MEQLKKLEADTVVQRDPQEPEEAKGA